VPVRVVAHESQARLLFDPMRREILRLLSRRAFSERELSEIIGITPPSIGHHLKALKEGQFISIVRREVGKQGIVQKWYLANAQAFIVDRERVPDDVRRYFMAIDIERTRGVAACMSLMRGGGISSTKSMESLTQQICNAICKAAEKYPGRLEEDPETVVHQMYVQALKTLKL
jgi:DNA-binding transcriptional ArsR family regulator